MVCEGRGVCEGRVGVSGSVMVLRDLLECPVWVLKKNITMSLDLRDYF